MNAATRVFHAIPVVLMLPWLSTIQAEVPVKPAAPWIRVDTAHFVVFSNATEATAIRLGLDLETLRQVLARLQPGREVRSPKATLIYLFKDRDDFAPYKFRYRGQPAGIDGLFWQDEDANLVALGLLPGRHTARVVYHEFLHFFLNHNMPYCPTWFDEGIAEYYSTFEIDGDQAIVGKPLMRHSQTLMRQSYLDLERFFAVHDKSPEYNEQDRNNVFYAQAWLLAHYVYGGHPELKSRLHAVVERLRGNAAPARRRQDDPGPPNLMMALGDGDGDGPTAARLFEDEFDTDLESFQKQLEAYRRHGQFPRETISIADLDVDTSTTVRPLPPAEMVRRLGDLLAATRREEPEIAEAFYLKALELDPKHAAAYRGLGRLAMGRSEVEAAERHLRKAIELAAEDYLSHKHLGMSLVRQATENPGVPDQALLKQGVELLKRGASLAPAGSLVRDLYGNALTIQGTCEPGLAVLTERLATTTRIADVAHDLAVLFAKCDRIADAWNVIDEHLGGVAVKALRKSAFDTVVDIEWNAAITDAKSGRHEAAVSRLEALLAGVPEPSRREAIAAEAQRIRKHHAANALIERYNEAVALANQGRYREAGEILRDVERQATKPELKQAAQDLLDRLPGGRQQPR